MSPVARRHKAKFMTRWIATIFYRTDAGLIDVDHDFEEIADLHGLVEAGPDWNTIDRIEVRLARKVSPALTVEQAENEFTDEADMLQTVRDVAGSVKIPVTVKTRIGIDRDESTDRLYALVEAVRAAGRVGDREAGVAVTAAGIEQAFRRHQPTGAGGDVDGARNRLGRKFSHRRAHDFNFFNKLINIMNTQFSF